MATSNQPVSVGEGNVPSAVKSRYDPEYEEWAKPYNGAHKMPGFNNALEFRAWNDPFMAAAWGQLPVPENIIQTKYQIRVPSDYLSDDGTRTAITGGDQPKSSDVEITLTRFSTQAQLENTTPAPTVLFMHGGGLVASTVPLYVPLIAGYAVGAGIQIFAVEYRLAPEHPAPTAVEDCYSTIKWLHAHGGELGVDPARIGVLGDSAGGNLAAGVSLLARDRKLNPPIAKQILVYPMLDDRTINTLSPQSVIHEYTTIPYSICRTGWEAYLGTGPKKAGSLDEDAEVSPYAAPARAKDLKGLPSTYMEVGTLDVFRDECCDYAARLAVAEVEVEFHLWAGIPHGFESASTISVVKRAMEGRVRTLQSF